MSKLHLLAAVFLLLNLVLAQSPCGDNTCLCGDCNNDGRVTVLDALTAAQHSAGLIQITSGAVDTFSCCNVSGTPGSANTPGAAISIVDALVIAQHSVGYIPRLECEENATLLYAGSFDFAGDAAAVISTAGFQRCADISFPHTPGTPTWVTHSPYRFEVSDDGQRIFILGYDNGSNLSHLWEARRSDFTVVSTLVDSAGAFFGFAHDGASKTLYTGGTFGLDAYSYDGVTPGNSLTFISSLNVGSVSSVEWDPYGQELWAGMQGTREIIRFEGVTAANGFVELDRLFGALPGEDFIIDICMDEIYLYNSASGGLFGSVFKTAKPHLTWQQEIQLHATSPADMTAVMWMDLDNPRNLLYVTWLEIRVVPGQVWTPHLTIIDTETWSIIRTIDPPAPSSLLGGVVYDEERQRLYLTRNVDQFFMVPGASGEVVVEELDASGPTGPTSYTPLNSATVTPLGYARQVEFSR